MREKKEKLKIKIERPDGRTPEEIREMKAGVGIIENATGSAFFSFGKTEAIAAVYGPRELYPQHLQNPERCLLRCYYDMTPFSVSQRKKPGPSRRSIEISMVTTKALEPVIDLSRFPNSVIDVYILITQANASTRCAGINAASIALANAGIPMREMVSAISVGKIGDLIIVDLTKEEEDFSINEKKCATDMPLAFTSRTKKITLLQLDGEMSPEEFKKAIEMGKKASEKVLKKQIEALKKIKNKS